MKKMLVVILSLVLNVFLFSYAGAQTLIKTLKGHKGSITYLTFTQDGKYLISQYSHYDSTAKEKFTTKIWDAKTFKLIRTIKGQSIPEKYKKNIPREIYTVEEKNDDVIIKDSSNLKVVKKIPWSALLAGDSISGLSHLRSTFSADGKYLLLFINLNKTYKQGESEFDFTGALFVLDGKNFSLIKKVEFHPFVDGDIAVSPDDKFVAAGSFGNSMVLVNLQNSTVMDRYFDGFSLVFSKNGKYLITATCDDAFEGACTGGNIFVYDVKSDFKLVKKLEKHKGLSIIAQSPDGKAVAAGSDDGDIIILGFK